MDHGLLSREPLHVARHNPIHASEEPNCYYAVVPTHSGEQLELWRWQRSSRDYEVIMAINASEALSVGDGIILSGKDGLQFCSGSNGAPYLWNGDVLEWLDPKEWIVYYAANARFEHLVGAPIRRRERLALRA